MVVPAGTMIVSMIMTMIMTMIMVMTVVVATFVPVVLAHVAWVAPSHT